MLIFRDRLFQIVDSFFKQDEHGTGMPNVSVTEDLRISTQINQALGGRWTDGKLVNSTSSIKP